MLTIEILVPIIGTRICNRTDDRKTWNRVQKRRAARFRPNEILGWAGCPRFQEANASMRRIRLLVAL
jgi:hypothetical protein